jgi:hypothetical protein
VHTYLPTSYSSFATFLKYSTSKLDFFKPNRFRRHISTAYLRRSLLFQYLLPTLTSHHSLAVDLAGMGSTGENMSEENMASEKTDAVDTIPKDTSHEPPDGGVKAWLCVFGCFLLQFSSFGYVNAYVLSQYSKRPDHTNSLAQMRDLPILLPDHPSAASERFILGMDHHSPSLPHVRAWPSRRSLD